MIATKRTDTNPEHPMTRISDLSKQSASYIHSKHGYGNKDREYGRRGLAPDAVCNNRD